MKAKRKGLNFFAVSIIFSVTAVIIFSGLLFLSHVINNKSAKVQQAISTANSCEYASRMIKDVSADLSEMAYFFVMTHNVSYAEDYVNEKYINRQRESAQKKIEGLPEVSGETIKQLRLAMEQTSSLAYIELYAMKLASMSVDSPLIPEQIVNQKIRPEHISLDKEEMQKVAQEIIFDQGYLDAKKLVNNSCSSIIDEIESRIKNRLLAESRILKVHIILLDTFIVVLFIISTLFSIFIWFLILKPLNKHVRSIKNKESLNVVGSKELRLLADTYNEVHEYDSLTRILNRRAFDEICAKSEKSRNSIGLLLVDLDNFKEVNDSYGHAKGDYVLRAIATILTTFFRKEGDVARIGGDEFAVVLSDYSVITPEFMTNKIDSINRELLDLDDVSNISISCGLAYSTKGYSKELYENADRALYQVKGNGKRGLCVWKEIL